MKITDIKLAVARKKLQKLAENSVAEGKEYKLGIILDSMEEGFIKPFLKLKEDLHLKQHEINLIICPKKVVKNDIFDYPLISGMDFSWNGRISHQASGFLEAKYDVLVSFTASENKIANFLVSQSRAGLKTGRKIKDKNGIFDLYISAALSEPEIFTEELKKYLKILNTTT